MSTYERADKEATALLRVIMKDHHPELAERQVTVDLLFAYGPVNEAGQKVGPAIKHHGFEAAGVCRITNLKDRAKGLADAEIVVDGDRWPNWGLARRRALLDHELTHLDVSLEDDDLKRPKLRLRKHDFQFGWFAAVAERWGADSFEVEQATGIVQSTGQLFFKFGPDGKAPEVTPAAEGAAVLKMARVLRDLRKEGATVELEVTR